MNFVYIAECKHCQTIDRERTDRRWMNRAFLSSNCTNCGKYKPWVVKYGQYLRKCPFFWTKPSTWFVGRIFHTQEIIDQ